MSARLKTLLALGCVILLGIIVAAASGLRLGLLASLVGLASLALGRVTAARALAAAPLLAPPAAADPEAVRARALLEAIMNGMREGVLVVDQTQRVVAANSAARGIFGRDAGTLVGQALSAVTRSPAVLNIYRAVIERGAESEVKVELLGEERRVFDLRVVSLGPEGARGALGVFFDITQLERLERVRQEFLSNVSHELRTPLTAILASVETLEDGALDDAEAGRRFAAVIRKNAVRMRALIEDILELSAIEAGTMKVEFQRVNLYKLVGEACAALTAKAAARNVILSNQVPPQAYVRADPQRLEQILINLLDNAIKFSRPGSAVTVRHEGGARDRISVCDTGEGIAPEHLPRIFERFYRVDRARSRELGGTGLGLAIVKHLARAHGGEVSVQSTPGSGSTFTIELPVCDQPTD